MWLSVNQAAQLEGDTGANAVKRLKAREAAVRVAWLTEVYEHGEPVRADRVVRAANLPEPFVRQLCERFGYGLV